MEKQVLKFATLEDLTRFSKFLKNGYLINTINLSVSATMSEFLIQLAQECYGAACVELQVKNLALPV